jgi:hypothetical protein
MARHTLDDVATLLFVSHADAAIQIVFCDAAIAVRFHRRSTRQLRCGPRVAGGAPSDAVGVIRIGGSSKAKLHESAT